jgi:hypothetical protein
MANKELRELLDLDLVKVRFLIRPLNEINFYSFSGTTIRGALGTVLRDHLCVNKKIPCVDCRHKHGCVYSFLFETPPPEDTEIMRLYPQAPHPFVIRPPSKKIQANHIAKEFPVELLLMGKGIAYLPYLAQAIFELGERGLGAGRKKYQVVSLEGAAPDGWLSLYRGGDKKIGGEINSLRWSELIKTPANGNTVVMDIHTPMRIKYGGKMVRELSGHILARNLLRRAASLLYFHAGVKVSWDFRRIIAQSEKVQTSRDETKWIGYDRYSGRQKQSMDFGGIVGKIVFDNVPDAIRDLYSFGSLIGAGKNTSFGLGWYSVQ